MKRVLLVAANMLALCGAASAQVIKVPAIVVPTRAAPAIVAPAATGPAAMPRVPFGCEARAPNVCYFRIFYKPGDRVVILPAGMKEQKVPVIAGGNYCMTLNKPPVFKCTRKVVNDKYNS
jgi:hypothetical protein